MGAGFPTGIAGLAVCISRHRQRLVFLAASDADTQPNSQLIKTHHERALHRFGIRHASKIISQTHAQAELFQENFNRLSEVLRLPLAPSVADHEKTRLNLEQGKAHVVWVGRISPEKRPEWILQAAARLRDVSFHLVGSSNIDGRYQNEVMTRATCLTNVTVHGRLSDDDLASLYKSATVLCCTSVTEGFPTTFLEAWRDGLPVISSFDPDRLIVENDLGVFVESTEELVHAIRHLTLQAVRQEYSIRCKTYFSEQFSTEALVRSVWRACET
jgi:glycosyltransferase involved in cell wall biosynthesis